MAPLGAVLSLSHNESITFAGVEDDCALPAALNTSTAERGAPGRPGEGLDTPPTQVAQCGHDDNGPSQARIGRPSMMTSPRRRCPPHSRPNSVPQASA